ncbi:MAG: hypothetical protein GY710_02055 [Desulfobacteraceae bacterium]|nr:hypothetical protein [Desulfobacteraceae bacterium]
MKAHKIELLVVDSSDIGIEMIKYLLESTLIYCKAQKITTCEWQNEHLLDKKSTADAEYKRLFG